ncbi:CPBP family intramembrane glutamic endopeptidase [Paenibacillus daejeonensis]|uniref:CPBP family intramembrane glutamic endopeptidase n=1 Tax=Paenibacillus daejeonensis TaxID=135193 RepID=UPI0003751050|nr:CPBP family intramembrane glutamic endopeptidase [Paenibacillus daejeonensis]
MNSLPIEPPWRRLLVFSMICLAIYLLLQIVPQTAATFFSSSAPEVMDKAEAEQNAVAFVREQFDAVVADPHAVYQTDRLLNGYLAKEKQLEAYHEQYGGKYPPDTYQVSVRTPHETNFNMDTYYFVYLNMETGEVVSWNRKGSTPEGEMQVGVTEQAMDNAIAFAETQGFSRDELSPRGMDREGFAILDVSGRTIGEAALELRIRTVESNSGEFVTVGYKPSFVPPTDYITYVQGQDELGTMMTLLGYLGLTIVLFILSIVYAAIYRGHTSFARGLFMTGFFLVFYIINNLNMMDGVRAGLGEEPGQSAVLIFGMAITMLLSVAMAASVYFALVAGDGLWREAGRNLWPRFGEPGYGAHVWQSMKVSYLWAFILLGLQTLIFLLLEQGFGTWTTTDSATSVYNLSWPWLYPMLAWCAAISEEAVYRLFGIGLLRKWFKNLFVASLIPTVIWALGHVSYPFYPATTRLIELTIIGLLFSYIFLKYGFLTAVFTHAIVNSIMMALMLIFLGEPVNITAGIFYIVLPVLVAWVMRWWSDTRSPRHPAEEEEPPVTVPPSTL